MNCAGSWTWKCGRRSSAKWLEVAVARSEPQHHERADDEELLEVTRSALWRAAIQAV